MNLREISKGIKIVIIAVAVLIIVGVIIGILYWKTDLFKTKEQLFWQALSKNSEIINLIDVKNVESNNKSYKKISTIETEISGKKIVANIDTKYNNIDKIQNTSIDIKNDDNNLLDIGYIRDDNIYALTSSQVVNGYIGIKNENLKKLADKILDEEYKDLVPDKILEVNTKNFSEITELEMEHIIEVYMNVIMDTIENDNYSKQTGIDVIFENTNYNATQYKLVLTQSELVNVQINILERLKTDSITLNLISTKLKSLSLPDEVVGINALNSKIEKMIAELKNKQLNNNEYFEISVYDCEDGITITEINIIGKRNIKILYNQHQQKLILQQEIIQNEENNNMLDLLEKISITRNSTDTLEEYTFEIKIKQWAEVYINSKKENKENGYLIIATIKINEQEINFKQECEFVTDEIQIQELTKGIKQYKRVIINNLKKDKLNTLLEQLQQRITTVINEEIEMLQL